MAGFSSALAAKLFTATLAGSRSNLVAPAGLYLSLHSAAPVDNAAPASELTYSGYARKDVGSTTVFTHGTDETTGGEITYVVENSVSIEFGASATAVAQTVSHWALWDVSTNGTADNLLYSGALQDGLGAETTRSIQEGDIPVFQPGQIKIKFV